MTEQSALKFTVETKTFLQAINFSLGIIEKRNVINELNNIKLSAYNGELVLGATDIDLYLNQKIGAEVITEGVITVCAQTLKDVISNVSDENVMLSYNNSSDKLEVIGKNCKFDLVTLPAQRFPVMENVESEIKIEVLAKDLAILFEYTKFAMSREETRYTLNGVYLHGNKGDLCAAATDCHRLSFAAIPLEELPPQEFGVIIPRKTVNEIVKIIKDAKNIGQIVSIYFADNKIKFEINNVTLISKVVDGSFPDYQNFIPEDNPSKLIIDKKMISASVTRVAAITTGLSRAIKISVDNNDEGQNSGSIRIHAAGESRGLASELISFSDNEDSYCYYSGTNLVSGFNPEYIQEVLSAINSNSEVKRVELYFNDVISPLLIKKNDDSRDCFVIMPVKV